MAGNNAGKSVTNRDFGTTRPENDAATAKLMSSNAKDNMDCLTGTDDLKPYEGGSGMPKGPFGSQGKEA